MRTHLSLPLAAACGMLLLAACTAPQVSDEKNALGAEGYDVVAYFTEGEATEGSPMRTAAWNGRQWQFASDEHRRMFHTEPERYTPAYDGYCAWMLSRGRLARGRPQHWAIHQGRLFFNCNAEVHERWLQDRERLIGIADREWEKRGHN